MAVYNASKNKNLVKILKLYIYNYKRAQMKKCTKNK